MASTDYDIIFVGGGTTACVVAGRLATADPSLKILILEAGPHIRDKLNHVQPARYFSNLVNQDETFTYHVGKPSAALGGRALVVPSGRCVGGGSGVNFMMYTRAAASDYDDWEKLGNPGWGSKDLIPLAQKIETFQDDDHSSTHGSSGPIKVSMCGKELGISRDYLETAASYDKGRGFMDDVNGFGVCNAYGRWHKYIDAESGRRSDAASAFIYGPEHKNIIVHDRKRAIRVLFKDQRATGVEYVDDIVGRKKGPLDGVATAHASRLVVVSAGAFGSPLFLERSGIGSREILKKHNIQAVVDLPGVGENYRDHNLVFTPYFSGENSTTLDVIFHGDAQEIEPYATQWHKYGNGLMAHNGIDAGIKLRPLEKDMKELGTVFGRHWEDFFNNAPDKPVMWVGPLAGYVGISPNAPRKKYYTMGYYTEYPISVGRVHIKSGQDPYADIDFEAGFLDHEADVAVLRWAYKHGRELARRMKNYRGGFSLGHPKFPEGSAAVISDDSGPVDILASDIDYTDEDNKAIDEFHRASVETTWHSLGTCAMKPQDTGGVVDPRLNVYGVTGLKVADLSIAPSNVGANTYNTALVIGEKAAVIIAEELGIKGV